MSLIHLIYKLFSSQYEDSVKYSRMYYCGKHVADAVEVFYCKEHKYNFLRIYVYKSEIENNVATQIIWIQIDELL